MKPRKRGKLLSSVAVSVRMSGFLTNFKEFRRQKKAPGNSFQITCIEFQEFYWYQNKKQKVSNELFIVEAESMHAYDKIIKK